jgi:hypothetical protein
VYWLGSLVKPRRRVLWIAEAFARLSMVGVFHSAAQAAVGGYLSAANPVRSKIKKPINQDRKKRKQKYQTLDLAVLYRRVYSEARQVM